MNCMIVTLIFRTFRTMKTTHIAIALVASALTLDALAEDHAQQPSSAPDGLVAVFVDDQTGEELARDHGIQPLGVADLDGILNAVIQGHKPMRLLHLAVDEHATDNPVSRMEFRPYVSGKLPQAPPPTLPLRQLAEEMKRYRKERVEWQQGVLTYRRQVVTEVEGFVRQVTVNQLAVTQRFDQKLRARNGSDFSRSDIVGCLEIANGLLAGAARPVIVLNSDCVDRPANRPPRRQPLVTTQLDPKVTLIFVNTSRKPEKEILFQGLKNTVRHADSMAAAMELLVGMLGDEKPEPPEENQPAGQPVK